MEELRELGVELFGEEVRNHQFLAVVKDEGQQFKIPLKCDQDLADYITSHNEAGKKKMTVVIEAVEIIENEVQSLAESCTWKTLDMEGNLQQDGNLMFNCGDFEKINLTVPDDFTAGNPEPQQEESEIIQNFGGDKFHVSGHCHKKKRRGKGKGMPQFVKSIIKSKKRYGAPKKRFSNILRSIEDSMPQFKHNPRLIDLLLLKTEDQIKSILETAAQEVIAERPKVVEESMKEKEEVHQRIKEEKRQHKEKKTWRESQLQFMNAIKFVRKTVMIQKICPHLSESEIKERLMNDAENGIDIKETVKLLLLEN